MHIEFTTLLDMGTELNNPKISSKDSPKKRLTVKRQSKEYFGSRWAGLILLIITFIVSLFFYARGGLGDFLASVFSPAKYSIQK